MRTRREPICEPNANRTPAKKRRHLGVRKLDRPGRPNPYGVQWREKVFDDRLRRLVSKPKTLFFPTAAARDECYNEKLGLRRAGMLVESVSREELADFRAFKQAAQGVPWQIILAGYHENLARTGRKPCTLKVDKAVKDYLAKMKALRDNKAPDGTPDPKLGADTFRQKNHKLTLFAEQFGDMFMEAVPPCEIEEWIEDFDEVQSDVTFDNYVKHVSALYGHYIELKVLRENPTKDIKRRSDGVGEVKFISPAQTAQLFHTALTYKHPATGERIFLRIVARLALEAFIGLRFSSGCRIEKSDINFADKGILLPKKKLKTGMVAGGRGHYIDNLPEQIWEWLAIAPDETWVVKPRDYMGLKSLLFQIATVPHPHNCLRHGFCSYDIAAHKNPGRTATILCHKDQELLWKHYFGTKTVDGDLATMEMGKTYQRITPQTCAELAKGYRPYLWPKSAQLLAAPATPEAAPLQLPA